MARHEELLCCIDVFTTSGYVRYPKLNSAVSARSWSWVSVQGRLVTFVLPKRNTIATCSCLYHKMPCHFLRVTNQFENVQVFRVKNPPLPFGIPVLVVNEIYLWLLHA